MIIKIICFLKSKLPMPAMPHKFKTPNKEIATTVAKRGISISEKYLLIILLKSLLRPISFYKVRIFKYVGKHFYILSCCSLQFDRPAHFKIPLGPGKKSPYIRPVNGNYFVVLAKQYNLHFNFIKIKIGIIQYYRLKFAKNTILICNRIALTLDRKIYISKCLNLLPLYFRYIN